MHEHHEHPPLVLTPLCVPLSLPLHISSCCAGNRSNPGCLTRVHHPPSTATDKNPNELAVPQSKHIGVLSGQTHPSLSLPPAFALASHWIACQQQHQQHQERCIPPMVGQLVSRSNPSLTHPWLRLRKMERKGLFNPFPTGINLSIPFSSSIQCSSRHLTCN